MIICNDRIVHLSPIETSDGFLNVRGFLLNGLVSHNGVVGRQKKQKNKNGVESIRRLCCYKLQNPRLCPLLWLKEEKCLGLKYGNGTKIITITASVLRNKTDAFKTGTTVRTNGYIYVYILTVFYYVAQYTFPQMVIH